MNPENPNDAILNLTIHLIYHGVSRRDQLGSSCGLRSEKLQHSRRSCRLPYQGSIDLIDTWTDRDASLTSRSFNIGRTSTED